MRTIRIELEEKTTPTGAVKISTEVIVEEGSEREAGQEAKVALDQFIEGYNS